VRHLLARADGRGHAVMKAASRRAAPPQRAAALRLAALRWLAGCLGFLAGWATLAQSVTLLLSEPGGIYLEAAQALRQELEVGNGLRIRQQILAERRPGEAEDLVVALGVRAYAAALSEPGGTPVLALLVPRQTYERLLAERGQGGPWRPVGGLYLDQPPARQLQLLQLALPGTRRVGVLVGADSTEQAEALAEAARSARLQLQTQTVSSPGELFTALGVLSGQAQALLLLPDASVVNRGTLQSLLLQTYRERLPVVGYSAALADAGAILGLYATPAQLGREAAQLIRTAFRGGELRLPPARHPETFSLRINRSVARSLGIVLPAEAELTSRLR